MCKSEPQNKANSLTAATTCLTTEDRQKAGGGPLDLGETSRKRSASVFQRDVDHQTGRVGFFLKREAQFSCVSPYLILDAVVVCVSPLTEDSDVSKPIYIGPQPRKCFPFART